MRQSEFMIPEMVRETFGFFDEDLDAVEWFWKLIDRERWSDFEIHQKVTAEFLGRIAKENGLPAPGSELLTPIMALFMRVVPQEMRSEKHFASAANFNEWYVIDGLRELKIVDFATSAQLAFLQRPHPDFPGISRYWGDAWLMRPDLQAAFHIGREAGMNSFMMWILQNGVHEYRAYQLIAGELEKFALLHIQMPGSLQVSNFFASLLSQRKDVLEVCQSQPSTERLHWLYKWFLTYGRAETGFIYYPEAFRSQVLSTIDVAIRTAPDGKKNGLGNLARKIGVI